MSIKFGIKSHYQDHGTDIYVKKIDPGAGYGSGYMVEIYDYGQKSDEIKVNTKKEVLKIIKEQKEKYNTDRAFENETHLFVSYKVDDIESPKFRKQKGIQVKESGMNNIDTELYKKASRINYLLSASKYPDIPLKTFRYGEELLNFEEPSAEDNLDLSSIGINAETTEDQIVSAIKETIVSYFSQTDHAVDEQYNKTKQWLSKIMKGIVSKANETYNLNLNLNSIADKLTTIFSNSGLPGEEILFKSAKDLNIVKTAEVPPANFMGTSMRQDRSQISNMSNTTMNLQATNDINSPKQQEGLSNEAKNLVDKVNTIKENPYEAYSIIKNTPNSESLVTEIKDKGQGTEAEFLILNSKIGALNYITEKVNDNFSHFLRYAQVKKGRNSFNAVYSKWRKENSFTPFMEELLLVKKAYVVTGIIEGMDFRDNFLKIYAHMRLEADRAISRYANVEAEVINDAELGEFSFTYDRAIKLTVTEQFTDLVWEAAAKMRNVSPGKYKESAEILFKKISETGMLGRFVQSLLAYCLITEHSLNAQHFLSVKGTSPDVVNNLQSLMTQEGFKQRGEAVGLKAFEVIYDKMCDVFATQLAKTNLVTDNENSGKFLELYFTRIKSPEVYNAFITEEVKDGFFKAGLTKAKMHMGLTSKNAGSKSNRIKTAVNIIINEAADGSSSVEVSDENIPALNDSDFDADLDFSVDDDIDDILGVEDTFNTTEESDNYNSDFLNEDVSSPTDQIETFDSFPSEDASTENEKNLIDMLRED